MPAHLGAVKYASCSICDSALSWQHDSNRSRYSRRSSDGWQSHRHHGQPAPLRAQHPGPRACSRPGGHQVIGQPQAARNRWLVCNRAARNGRVPRAPSPGS